VRSVASLAEEVLGASRNACFPQPRPDLRRRQLATLWRLRAAYRQAADGPLSLNEIFARIVKESDSLRTTMVVWVDAIESMIQEVESLYGPAPGLGPIKAVQVKAAIVYIIDKADGRLPRPTLLVTETGLQAAVSWVVDGVVLILNQRQLWDLSPEDRLNLTYWFRLRTRMMTCIINLMGVLNRWIEGRTEMLPQVRVIADKVILDKNSNLLVRVSETMDFMVWFIENRRQLLGLWDLVAAATVEAEAFIQMSGPEKQQYARELVLLALQGQQDPWPDAVVQNPLARAVVDFAIDAVVRIFNKRGVFPSPSAATQRAA
jgi:hypothetical protein